MHAAIAFALFFITFATAAHLHLRPLHGDSESSDNGSEEVRQLLKNREDMTFTGSVNISGERLNLVMDSGSFEIVLFEKGCDGCGESSTYFDPSEAQSNYEETGQQNLQSYGSGDVASVGAFANVRIPNVGSGGPLNNSRQLFWLGTMVRMDVATDATFSGIFGLGPPSSALHFAQEEEAYVEDVLGSMSESEAKQYKDILGELRGVVRLEKRTSPFLQLASSGVFSICLLPGLGSNGYVIFNDKATEHITSWITPVDSGFWEVPVSNAKIGDMKFSKNSCTGIVDSGTSLIGVPEAFYTKIADLVYELVEKHGGCDDLASWPRFDFKVGGKQLSLAASSYVALYDWDDYEIPQGHMRFMPHLNRSRATLSSSQRAGVRETSCEPMVFSMGGLGDDDGCQFLFGLPIFREYYISHKIDVSTGAAAKMAFSVPNPTCNGVGNGDDMMEHPFFKSPLVLKPSKIRFPTAAVKPLRSARVQKILADK